MEEIKVGDFIRTTDGYIRKIDNINTDKNIITRRGKYILDIPYKNSQSVAESKIVKHSPNIIDLIEEGDYVNGVEVVDLDDGRHLKFANDVSFVDVGISTYRDGHVEGIKSIVTKEQFNQMKYIVGDESNE